MILLGTYQLRTGLGIFSFFAKCHMWNTLVYILTSKKLTGQVKPCAVGFLPFPGNMIPWYLCRTLFASFSGGYHSPNCSDFYQFSTIQQLLHEHMARMHQEGSEQNHVHVHCSGSFLQYSDTVWAVGGVVCFHPAGTVPACWCDSPANRKRGKPPLTNRSRRLLGPILLRRI